MAATVYDYDVTAANNTSFDSISQAENVMKAPAVNNAFRAHSAAIARLVDDLGGVNTVAGTGNAISVTLASGITAYATGQMFMFKVGAASTAAVTIDVNAIGAKALRQLVGGTDVAVGAGALQIGERYLVVYDAAANAAAGAWILTNPTQSRNPSFSVTRGGSNQASITATAYTKVQFNTEVFDTHSCFDNVTNFRYTPLVAGKYQFTLTVLLTALSLGKYIGAAIYKNGALSQQSLALASNTGSPFPSPSGSVAVILDANGTTDYFEAYIYNGDSSAQTLDGAAINSFFSGVRVA